MEGYELAFFFFCVIYFGVMSFIDMINYWYDFVGGGGIFWCYEFYWV